MGKYIDELNKNKKLKKEKKLVDYRWILKISIIAFTLSIVFSLLSETVMPKVNLWIGIIILILFIGIGIMFDMVGVAVTAAAETPFHSMAARKVRGAKVAVKFKKNAAQVSSFCNDVIGDICGIVSGSTGAILAITISSSLRVDALLVSLLVTALIAALTIGGKAMGKGFAVSKSNIILYEFSKIVSLFYNPKK
ncbi:MAG: hypothetical protein HFH09_02640 [Bacilli bacterium]|nr:hypothetical protein [Bacilli bacterium]